MGTGDKLQPTLPHAGLHVKCLAAGEPPLHKSLEPALPADCPRCPHRGRSWPLWLWGEPTSAWWHCQRASVARSPFLAADKLGHVDLAKVTAGAGLGEGPRCPDTCFHLLPAPSAGRRLLQAPTPGAPSSGKGDTRGTPRSPVRAGGGPSPHPFSASQPGGSRGCGQPQGSYLGLVEDQPDEGGDQQGPGHGGAGTQVLVKVGERGGLLGQRHCVRVPHGGPGRQGRDGEGQRRSGGDAGRCRVGSPGLGPAESREPGSGGQPLRSAAVPGHAVRELVPVPAPGLTAPERL